MLQLTPEDHRLTLMEIAWILMVGVKRVWRKGWRIILLGQGRVLFLQPSLPAQCLTR